MSADWQSCDQFGLTPAFATDERRLPITKELCVELAEAFARLRAVQAFEDRYTTIVDNYVEMEVAILRLSVLHSVRFSDVFRSAPTHRRTINRLLLNFLSACKQYIDQNSRHIEPLMVAMGRSFKAETSRCFDASFHYRFMEGLRNHVQHKDTGVHTITFTAGSSPGSDGLRHAFSVTVDTENLKQAGSVRSDVIDELQRMQNAPDLMLSIRGYLSCLASIHRVTRRNLDDVVQKSRQSIESSYAEFEKVYELPGASGFSVMAFRSAHPPIQVVYVGLEAISRLTESQNLNDCPIELERSFVSSESIPRKR